MNWAFYAPSVILTEVLFALCRKLQDGTIDVATHQKAVEDSNLSYLPAISPPPNGDAALLPRAEEIPDRLQLSSFRQRFLFGLN